MKKYGTGRVLPEPEIGQTDQDSQVTTATTASTAPTPTSGWSDKDQVALEEEGQA